MVDFTVVAQIVLFVNSGGRPAGSDFCLFHGVGQLGLRHGTNIARLDTADYNYCLSGQYMNGVYLDGHAEKIMREKWTEFNGAYSRDLLRLGFPNKYSL